MVVCGYDGAAAELVENSVLSSGWSVYPRLGDFGMGPKLENFCSNQVELEEVSALGI